MASGASSGVSDKPSKDGVAIDNVLDPHVINYMRLAVAVAIIKQKPADQSAQEYTEQLCIQFRQMQLKWKAEVEELRATVSLLKSQLQEETRPPAELTQVYRASATNNSEDGELYPTPPCSTQDNDEVVKSTQQTQFMNGVLTLSNISLCEPSEVNIVTHGASLQSALITLGDLLTRPGSSTPVISRTVLQHMVQVLISLVENRCSFPPDFTDVVLNKVLCFIWGLITAMLVSNDLQQYTQDCLSDVVVSLSQSCMLRPAIVRMLVKQLLHVGEHLRAVCLSDRHLDESLFRNSYHILRSIEQILEADIARKDKRLGLEFCHEIFNALDNCLLHTSERFPPFAQYARCLQGLLHYLHPALTHS